MPDQPMPYKLACLCDLRDASGRLLLLHRLREPNKGLCSPIGGKLDMPTGESPTQCAQREIKEEAGIDVPIDRLHLMALISERAFEGKGHWLLFYYRVMGPVEVPEHDINEGSLRWHETSELDTLPIPQTDRQIIWPLVRGHEARSANGLPGFFSLHIDCDESGPVRWSVEHSVPGT